MRIRLTIGFATNEIDVGHNPEHFYPHDNIYENNGYEADPFVQKMLGRGFDIIWHTNGADNHFDEQVQVSFICRAPSGVQRRRSGCHLTNLGIDYAPLSAMLFVYFST